MLTHQWSNDVALVIETTIPAVVTVHTIYGKHGIQAVLCRLNGSYRKTGPAEGMMVTAEPQLVRVVGSDLLITS